MDLATAWLIKQANQAKQARFSATAWPHQGDELAALDVEIDAIERTDVPPVELESKVVGIKQLVARVHVEVLLASG